MIFVQTGKVSAALESQDKILFNFKQGKIIFT